jgi:hypothetical protein
VLIGIQFASFGDLSLDLTKRLPVRETTLSFFALMRSMRLIARKCATKILTAVLGTSGNLPDRGDGTTVHRQKELDRIQF